MTRNHVRAAALVAGLALVGACSEPLPPLRYETEQAVIGTEFNDPLCSHDLPWIDELEHSLTASGIRFEAGIVHTIELTQGLYKIAIPVEEDGQRVEVSLARVE